MGMRHTLKARRALTAVAITTGLALTVAGCSGGDDDKSDKENTGSTSSPSTTEDQEGGEDRSGGSQTPAEDEVLAEVTGGDNVTLTFNSAVRDDGGFLTVTGKVKNGGAKRVLFTSWRGDEKELQANGASLAGANLIDKASKKRYLILRDTQGRCLCTQFKGGINAGEERPFFAQFPAPPEGTNKVDFQIADMPPAAIEISEGE
ncbi:copper resistance CopC family protein [Streptomyces apocyni]|uniref:hypothetical protein n=1 Tax=Streptomyces apocyni TaxID=2654677 RepID=UPI0012EA0CEA|nr:hypothetical protein [Streptomyces apocyni]